MFAICLPSCTREAATESTSCGPCRTGFAPNHSAQSQIAKTWQQIATRVGRQANDLDLRCLCFGSGDSLSIEGGALHLPAEWSPSEQTARAAHLALHQRQTPWAENSALSCEQRVERAVHGEAEAHALELDAREALQVATRRYPFEAEYVATAREQRVEWLYSYFLSHPRGDGVVPGFVLQYSSRCAANKTSPSGP
jgi:hypothetical protein